MGYIDFVVLVFKCYSEYGVCWECYGIFFVIGKICDIGDVVGIIAV